MRSASPQPAIVAALMVAIPATWAYTQNTLVRSTETGAVQVKQKIEARRIQEPNDLTSFVPVSRLPLRTVSAEIVPDTFSMTPFPDTFSRFVATSTIDD